MRQCGGGGGEEEESKSENKAPEKVSYCGSLKLKRKTYTLDDSAERY